MSSNIASTLIRLAGAAGMCLLPSLAGAQGVLMERNISLALARDIANVAMDTCTAKGFRVSITVVDRNGMVRLSYRGDGTNPHTVENSFRKAYTSRTFRIPSGEFVKRVKDNPTIGQVHLANIIASAGALPIKVGDDTIGAVGVSGAPGGNDEPCAKAGIDKVADRLK